MTSRTEHLEWCKQRALSYLGVGNTTDAISSMISDLRKHPETENHAAIPLTAMLLMAGQLSTVEDVRKHINGFN